MSMTTRADKFRQAATAYVGLGIVVIGLTLIAGTAAERGTPPLRGLLIGAGFVVAFGLLMYSYGWLERGWEIWRNWAENSAINRNWGIWHSLIAVYFFPFIYFI